jgi:uncharacterized protein YicC (UPF0701 family)
MTGYASRSFDFEEYTLFMEIRSLNNRFLELRFKLPFYLEQYEEVLRKRLKQQVKRGKVDVFVKVFAKEQMEMRMLRDLFTKYGRLLHLIERRTPTFACRSLWPTCSHCGITSMTAMKSPASRFLTPISKTAS